jgi:hypothetical protein
MPSDSEGTEAAGKKQQVYICRLSKWEGLIVGDCNYINLTSCYTKCVDTYSSSLLSE